MDMVLFGLDSRLRYENLHQVPLYVQFFRLCNKSVEIIPYLMGNEQHSSCRDYLVCCLELWSLHQYEFLNLLISVLCKTCEQFFEDSESILLTWMTNKSIELLGNG